METPQPTSYTPQFSSNPSEHGSYAADEDVEFFLECIESWEDFWWDEEERHELF